MFVGRMPLPLRKRRASRSGCVQQRSCGLMDGGADVCVAASCRGGTSYRRALAMADEACSLMVSFNLRLLPAVARRYLGRGMELDELVSEVCVCVG